MGDERNLLPIPGIELRVLYLLVRDLAAEISRPTATHGPVTDAVRNKRNLKETLYNARNHVSHVVMQAFEIWPAHAHKAIPISLVAFVFAKETEMIFTSI
jgi:hypothetical protein